MKTRSKLAYVLPVVAIIGMAVLVTNVIPMRPLLAQRAEIGAAQERLRLLEAENARLAGDAEALKGEGEVERIARSNLGYVRPGETAYRVVFPEPEPEVVAPPVVAAPSWYDRLWAYVTGQDLIDSG